MYPSSAATARVLLAMIALFFPVGVSGAQRENGPLGIGCERAAWALRNGSFDLHVGRARLRDGKACLKLIAESATCDWSVELTRVEWWGTTRPFLLVTVNSNHLTGSGAWDSVFIYSCERGRITPVFSERYLYGAKIQLGKVDFWVTSGLWLERDPNCCPSNERSEQYVWDEQRKNFVLGASRVSPLKRQ